MTWTVENLPGGVRLTHSCGQYRSFHQGEWVGLMMDIMTSHQCPDPARKRPAHCASHCPCPEYGQVCSS